MPRTGWLTRQLESPRLPRRLALLAFLLASPGIFIGLLGDDHLHRAAILGIPAIPAAKRPPSELFRFVKDDPVAHREMLERGELPWWSDDHLRAALYRPVTGITHWLDYQLPPSYAWLMHIHSLLWFAGAVAAAAACYRRIIPSAWTAGVAGVLYAIDDARGVPAVWLANRNAVVGFLFGALSLLLHDRWRREGKLWAAILSPGLFLLGLLGNEGAAAFGGYLLAYALLIDKGPLVRRLASLLPYALVGVAWLIAYKRMGYGTFASSVYIDPAAEPLRYLRAAAVRAPILLWGQFASPGSDLYPMLRPDLARMFPWIATALVAVLAMLFLPVLRKDRVARFWALGMLLSLAPVCATFPSDRLLTFVGFGGMGLLAHFFASVRRSQWGGRPCPPAAPVGMGPRVQGGTGPRTRGPVERADDAESPDRSLNHEPTLSFRLRRIAAGPLVFIHFILAPFGLFAAAGVFGSFSSISDRIMNSFPADEHIREQTVLIVQTPSAFLAAFAPVLNGIDGLPIPARSITLCSSMNEVEVRRPDERTLVLRPDGGYLANPRDVRTVGPGPIIEPGFVFLLLDHLFRDDDRPLPLGAKVELKGLTFTVTALTPDRRPQEVTIVFDRPLEDENFRWLKWGDGVYEPFTVPKVGETVKLPPARVRLPI